MFFKPSYFLIQTEELTAWCCISSTHMHVHCTYRLFPVLWANVIICVCRVVHLQSLFSTICPCIYTVVSGDPCLRWCLGDEWRCSGNESNLYFCSSCHKSQELKMSRCRWEKKLLPPLISVQLTSVTGWFYFCSWSKVCIYTCTVFVWKSIQPFSLIFLHVIICSSCDSCVA